MQTVDPAQFQKRIDRITRMFEKMIEHADEQSLVRCPYKNRFDQCTAQFGCRYRRPANQAGALPICTSDDKLDYRPAWEMDGATPVQVQKP
jgi:hypothetical protein